MMKSGIDAILVKIPNRMKMPQIISNAPVKYAQNAGSLKPILKNLPGPNISGNKYFWIPSVRKMSPTIILTNITLLSFPVLRMDVLYPVVGFIAIKHVYTNQGLEIYD